MDCAAVSATKDATGYVTPRILAAWTPCLRLRRIDGAYFHTYVESFERVWSSARPLEGEPDRQAS